MQLVFGYRVRSWFRIDLYVKCYDYRPNESFLFAVLLAVRCHPYRNRNQCKLFYDLKAIARDDCGETLFVFRFLFCDAPS